MAIERCRDCRESCERYLARLDPERGVDPNFSDTIRCTALLSMIAERLDTADSIPWELIEATVDLVRELPEDAYGCAAACAIAADALADWLDGGFERA
jgi:hypothetical protein